MIQSFHDQVSIRFVRHGPADHTACIQIHHHRQIAPALACPDKGNITAPNLIWLFHIKLLIQPVWDIQSLHGGMFISMRPRLLTDQPQLGHQSADFEATYVNAQFGQ